MVGGFGLKVMHLIQFKVPRPETAAAVDVGCWRVPGRHNLPAFAYVASHKGTYTHAEGNQAEIIRPADRLELEWVVSGSWG